jgi:hypothetical protein
MKFNSIEASFLCIYGGLSELLDKDFRVFDGSRRDISRRARDEPKFPSAS